MKMNLKGETAEIRNQIKQAAQDKVKVETELKEQNLIIFWWHL